jgi:hypothetical protein
MGFLMDGWFPLCVTEYAEDGELIDEWDGTTYDYSSSLPSKSESSLITVVGQGTPYPVGVSLLHAVALSQRIGFFKITHDLSEGTYSDDSNDIEFPVKQGSGSSLPSGSASRFSCPNGIIRSASFLPEQAKFATYDPDDDCGFTNSSLSLFQAGKKILKSNNLYYPKIEAEVTWHTAFAISSGTGECLLTTGPNVNDFSYGLAILDDPDDPSAGPFGFQPKGATDRTSSLTSKIRYEYDPDGPLPLAPATVKLKTGLGFPDLVINLYDYTEYISSGFPFSGSGEVVYEPYNYHSYNGIYDEDTGERI